MQRDNICLNNLPIGLCALDFWEYNSDTLYLVPKTLDP